MAETARFLLPLVEAAQAQKHVTVNEALARLDGLIQLRLKSASTGVPPVAPQEGDAYGVGGSAVNGWAGQDGKIALFVNGGWMFVAPSQGMRAFIVDQGGFAVFNGTSWVIGMQTMSLNGAGLVAGVAEYDHIIGAGTTSSVAFALPGQAIVYGVTGRVQSDITGTLTGFALGTAGSANRYGSGLSLSAGSWLRGMTGTPMTYYADEDLVLSAEGGDFAGGSIRIAVHYATLTLPA